ncbi:MAG: hemerythrin family protein [gamma proteobacterium endosymbiont of Lamellibrachia anaximandri]|nr:hemerythrin family protein [gamma proteobacterium endosymbiont of Lamellibrachia anaximandri]MBL3532721.1 hemerythrin family protein [gamma proteobacterium endosymbiont of Lamellibrachia anaximandri]MBL3598787.1 hemerythrin family protein [gamma proteobacterium endosymbiont of Lamellibrachia anaximandri]
MSKYNSPVLDPSAIPLIALGSMNETHKEEVELINQLGRLLEDAVNGQPDEAAITEKLHEWAEHTKDHFSRENQLMQDYGFPAFPVHSGEHDKVLAQIEALYQRWLETKVVEPLADYIFGEWPRWFDAHVNSMDMVTAMFLSQRIPQ